MGYSAKVTQNPQEIESSDKVVFPGVGNFEKYLKNLRKNNLIDTIIKVIDMKKPFLGICVGLQLLFEESEESLGEKGLGIYPGQVKRFANAEKVPHMGWNNIKILKPDCPLFKNISEKDYFYFTHSFYVDSKRDDINLCYSEYGSNFISAIWDDNLFATQFHPEKSQKVGLKVLKNFGEI